MSERRVQGRCYCNGRGPECPETQLGSLCGTTSARGGHCTRQNADITESYWTVWDFLGLVNGGAGGNRTRDLLNAIQALSQLSYGPNGRRILPRGEGPVKAQTKGRDGFEEARRDRKLDLRGMLRRPLPEW